MDEFLSSESFVRDSSEFTTIIYLPWTKLSFVDLIFPIEAGLAASAIVLGGIVEGYGYGLSLGTNWPYTRDIHKLALKGDPEAIHRIVATLIGLISLALVVIRPSFVTFAGLGLIVLTALLGMATLYVLAGRAPAFLQGLHGIVAYTTFITYLLASLGVTTFEQYVSFLISAITPPHVLYFVIFLGGWVTGSRRMVNPIGNVRVPKGETQWVWALHGIASLIFLASLVYLKMWLGLALALVEIAVGLWVYKSINANPLKPGISVGIHQLVSVSIVVYLVLNAFGYI